MFWGIWEIRPNDNGYIRKSIYLLSDILTVCVEKPYKYFILGVIKKTY